MLLILGKGNELSIPAAPSAALHQQEILLLQPELKTQPRRQETRILSLVPGEWVLLVGFGDAGVWGCSVSRAARAALSNILGFRPLLVKQTYFRTLGTNCKRIRQILHLGFILDYFGHKISLLLFQRGGTCDNWCFVEISWAITGFSRDKHCLWPHALSSQQQDYCLIKQLRSYSTIIL